MRMILVFIFCMITWTWPLRADQADSLLRAGDRFAVATFTDGIIQLIVQADGSLRQEQLLTPDEVGSVAVMDTLPQGKLAMAGFTTQLLLWDERSDRITALTNFPDRGTNWYHIDLTNDAHLGVFETIYSKANPDRIFSLEFTPDALVRHPIQNGEQPALSATGEWLAVVVDPPLDTISMTNIPARVEVSAYLSGDVIYVDDRGCTSPRFHPTDATLAYFCETEAGSILVLYELLTETRVEHPVSFSLCLTWSPDGERLLLSGLRPNGLRRPIPVYTVLDTKTGNSQILDLPQTLPGYDSMACLTWVWLSSPS